jgi:transposase-like protein
MPRPGPRITCRYTQEFKATPVRLSQLPSVAVDDVAARFASTRVAWTKAWRRTQKVLLVQIVASH